MKWKKVLACSLALTVAITGIPISFSTESGKLPVVKVAHAAVEKDYYCEMHGVFCDTPSHVATKTCTTCYGTKKITRRKTCSSCSGNGRVYDACSSCNGRGGTYTTCTGTLSCTWGSTSTKSVRCNNCDGVATESYASVTYSCNRCGYTRVSDRVYGISCSSCGYSTEFDHSDGFSCGTEIKTGTCGSCGGSGRGGSHTCSRCSGSGVSNETETVTCTTCRGTGTVSYTCCPVPLYKRKLNFNPNNGSCSTAYYQIKPGSQYGELPIATRKGYTFSGWWTAATGGSQVFSTTIMGNQHVTVYAHWVANSYTVYFANEEVVPNPLQKTIVFDQKYGDLPQPTRYGYDFKGWWTEKTGGIEIKEDSTLTECGITLHQRWEPKKTVIKLISYTPNEKGSETVTVTYTQKVPDITIPHWRRTVNFDTQGGDLIASETKERSFLGYWLDGDPEQYVNENGNGSRIWMLDGPNEYKAKWRDPVITLPIAHKTGYRFIGWRNKTRDKMNGTYKMCRNNETLVAQYVSLDYKIDLDSTPAQDTGDKRLTASFSKKVKKIQVPVWSRTLNFDSNGGTETKSIVNNRIFQGYYKNGTQYVDASGKGSKDWDIPADTVLTAKWKDSSTVLPVTYKDGYDFVGWVNEDGATVNGEYVVTKETETLTAVWKPSIYKVTLTNGDSPLNVSVEYGKKFNTGIPVRNPRAVFISDGIVVRSITYSLPFIGYWLGNRQITDGTGQSLEPWTSTAGGSLKAVWGECTFDFPVDPVKEGNTFTGWQIDGHKYLKDNYSTKDDHGLEFVAGWEANKYKVTYNYAANGGKSSTKYEDSVQWHKEVNLTPDAKKDDWYFLGWNVDKNAETALNSLTMESEPIELFAIFTKRTEVRYWDGCEEKSISVDGDTDEKTFSAPEYIGGSNKDEELRLDGWTFVGWTKDPESAKGKVYLPGENIPISGKEDRIYAAFEKLINIDFNYGSGSIKRESTLRVTSYDWDNIMTVGVVSPALEEIGRSSNDTLGWGDDKSDWDVVADFGSIVKPTRNVEYRLISIIDEVLEFYGAVEETVPIHVISNQHERKPVLFPMVDYKKLGYKIDSFIYDGKEYKPNSVAETIQSARILVKAIPNQYSIEFDFDHASGGKMETSKIEAKYDEEVKLPVMALKKNYSVKLDLAGGEANTSELRTNASFVGWDCDGSIVKDGDSVKNLRSENGDSITLKAVWKNDSVTLPTPKRDGYVFKGWYHNGEIVEGSAKPQSDTVVVAHWEVNGSQCTIELGDTDGKKSITIDPIYGELVPDLGITLERVYKVTLDYCGLKPTEVVEVGSKLDGIYSEPNGKGTKYYDGELTPIAKSTLKAGDKLYAYWIPGSIKLPVVDSDKFEVIGWTVDDKTTIEEFVPTKDSKLKLLVASESYNLTLDPGEGKIVGGAIGYYKYGEAQPLPNAELRGSVFVGWELDGQLVFEIPAYSIGDLSLKAKYVNYRTKTLEGDSSIKGAILPADMTEIPDGFFKGCTGLTEIDIPGTVKRIGNEAFKGCTNLEKVIMHEGTESIGQSAFEGCTKLKSIDVPGSVRIIEAKAFKDCTELESVTLHDGTEVIGDSAFRGCKSLTEITLPKTVKSVGDGVFAECSSLKSVTVLNPDCQIFLSSTVFPEGATIYGYKPSTACDYAEVYDREFVTLDEAAKITIKIEKEYDEVADVHYAFSGDSFPDEIKIPMLVDHDRANLTGVFMDKEGTGLKKASKVADNSVMVYDRNLRRVYSGSVPGDVELYAVWDFDTKLEENSTVNTGDTEKKDSSIVVSGVTYISENGKTMVTSVLNQKSITVKASIKLNGKSQSVDGIATGAFKGCTKLRTLKLEGKFTLQKGSLSGTDKNLTIKVPKAYKSYYKKSLKKAGNSKTKIKVG